MVGEGSGDKSAGWFAMQGCEGGRSDECKKFVRDEGDPGRGFGLEASKGFMKQWA